MIKWYLSFGVRSSKWKKASCITPCEYKEIMEYARKRHIKLEGFKRFSGDIAIVKEMIDDIVTIAKDFPRILTDRKSLVIRLDESMLDGDFATTYGHVVAINAKIFNNKDYLKKEYQLMSELGTFVKGTSYRSIIRHEIGHVVANIYRLNTMKIAESILSLNSRDSIYKYIMDNLSLYAAEYEDGVEFISESFSAYYSDIDNVFAKEYIDKCKEIIKEEE